MNLANTRVPQHASVEASDAEPEWRREVARRLEVYRARRRRYLPDDSQSPLPFQVGAREIDPGRDSVDPSISRGSHRLAGRAAHNRQPERVEISIRQPEFDFSAADDRAHPQTALVPVASVLERRHAAFLDVLFLVLSCAGFLGLFRSLGGQLSLAKVDTIVYAVIFFILYAVYFSLFTVFGGATPGMQLRGLYVVRLDGSLPETRQLIWRSFGYLLSGTTLLLGFLWSLWDEDQFTWHDRMSHTYVTASLPLGQAEPLEVPVQRHTFAHK
jgi:uncharacterized RDD family membrane protein YckC